MNKNQVSFINYIFPHSRDLLFILLFFLVVYVGPYLFLDGDSGRHLRVGEIILTQWKIPTKDYFSFTFYGAPYTPHEWIAQALYRLSYNAMGFNGMVLLAAALIAGAFTVAYVDSVKRGASHTLTFGIALWAAIASLIHWQARPHLFTYLILAIWAALMHRLANGKRISVWIFPAIMLAWANTHGGFLSGFLVWGAYTAGTLWDKWRAEQKPAAETLKRLFLAGGLSFAVTFINPVGWKLWATTVGHLGERYLMDTTQDFMSTDFHNPLAFPFLLMIALMIVMFSRPRKSTITTSESLLLAGLSMMGMYSVRNIGIFAVVAAPILANFLQPFFTEIPALMRFENGMAALQRQLRGVLIPFLIIAIFAGLLLSGAKLDAQKQGNGFLPQKFPIAAADWLLEHPQQGNMFNPFHWGGYLIYRLAPQMPVFIDGETTLYGEELAKEYSTLGKLEKGWQDVLEKYNIAWVIMPTDSLLANQLSQLGWNTLYSDDVAVILRKP